MCPANAAQVRSANEVAMTRADFSVSCRGVFVKRRNRCGTAKMRHARAGEAVLPATKRRPDRASRTARAIASLSDSSLHRRRQRGVTAAGRGGESARSMLLRRRQIAGRAVARRRLAPGDFVTPHFVMARILTPHFVTMRRRRSCDRFNWRDEAGSRSGAPRRIDIKRVRSSSSSAWSRDAHSAASAGRVAACRHAAAGKTNARRCPRSTGATTGVGSDALK
jgi:hypothetical protein